MKQLFCILFVFNCCAAQAAIIGLFHESEDSQIEMVVSDTVVTLKILTNREMEVIKLTQQLPSDGGNMAALMAALSTGQIPRNMLSGWVVGAGDNITVGIFENEKEMTYTSLFAGPITVPHLEIKRSAKTAEGKIFKFAIADLKAIVDPDQVDQLLNERKVSLVIQHRLPEDRDSSTKAIPIPKADGVFYSTSGCSDQLTKIKN